MITTITKTTGGILLILNNTVNYADGVYTIEIPVNAVKDAAGNELTTRFTSKFTVDTIAPTVSLTDPAEGAAISNVGKVVTITFSEDVNINEDSILGNITIRSMGKVLNITKVVNGHVLTLTNNESYSDGRYIIDIPPTSITDKAGNRFKGFFNSAFTIDTISPIVSSIDPVNGTINLEGNEKIRLTFNESILKSKSFWIELKNSNGTVLAIDKSISGKRLTITPSSDMGESLYTLIIHTGSLTDLAGNPVALTFFKFRVGASPVITSINPVNNALNVVASKTITLTFNEAIKGGTNWFELKNSSGSAVPFKYSISGKVLTIDPTSNLAESSYILIIHTGAVKDLAGNPVALKLSRFSVGSPPKVTKVDPVNGATKVARNKPIKVTFNENIKASSSYWIELKVSNGASVNIGKSISGKVLTVTHPRLAANTKYTLILHTGAVTDLAGNSLALKTYIFTTGA